MGIVDQACVNNGIVNKPCVKIVPKAENCCDSCGEILLKKRFPGSPLPKVVFTDRGLGFFHPNGGITAEWQAGLAAAGLRAYQGEDAGAQPGQVGDVLLHATAVSWLRAGLTATIPGSPETETEEDYYTRLQEVCADVNKRHDVADLCKGFRARLEKVVEKEGDAIGK